MEAATDTLPGILAIFNNVALGREAEFGGRRLVILAHRQEIGRGS